MQYNIANPPLILMFEVARPAKAQEGETMDTPRSNSTWERYRDIHLDEWNLSHVILDAVYRIES
jgi:hypothetical protein